MDRTRSLDPIIHSLELNGLISFGNMLLCGIRDMEWSVWRFSRFKECINWNRFRNPLELVCRKTIQYMQGSQLTCAIGFESEAQDSLGPEYSTSIRCRS